MSRGLYENIHAKRKRIKAGSGETMRKPGSKGAPTKAAFNKSAKTAKKRKQIMPMVGKKKYPYTREGMAAAMEDSKKSGKKMSYQQKKKMEDKKKSKK